MKLPFSTKGCVNAFVMEILFKLFSFFIPITRKVKSEYSGDLELTWIDGRKLLDASHANYSYGSLQRVLEFALRKIDLSAVENVLVLGLGGGSVIKSLRQVFDYQLVIVAVDIDPVIIEIAKKEFGVIPDYRTEIVCEDAVDYVGKDFPKFDLIIIDLFIGNKVPEKFFSTEFSKQVKAKVRDGGVIIFNSIIDGKEAFVPIKNQLKWGFVMSEYGDVEKVNHLLIARSRS